jgi:hypothetical protein
MVSGRETGVTFARARALVVVVGVVLGCAFLLLRDHSGAKFLNANIRPNPDQVRAAFARLPMSFEQNQGQANSNVKFLARGNGFGLYLSANEAALAFAGRAAFAVQMQLAGANPNAQVSGTQRLPGHSNYFIGNDPSGWHRNVPQFGRVVYREIYSGVDLAFYGNQGRLEYDFDVAPGADPNQIQLDLSGADQLKIAEDGDLVLTMNTRELRFQKPRVYQNSSSGQQSVSGSFILRADNRVSFKLGDYDRTRALVIDPVLSFSSYLGGAGDESCTGATGAPFVAHCPAISVDAAGNIYVAGTTTSTTTFAGITPQVPAIASGPRNVFVSKIRLSSSTSTLDFVTYLGGAGTQYPVGVGVDSGFNIFVAGTTSAGDYPVTSTAFQSPPVTGGNHVFVSELDATGSALQYSTYLAGDGADLAASMTVDTLAKVYVFGTTTSTNLPATPGALQTSPNAANQFFFAKVDPAAGGPGGLQYLTYIGGASPANGAVTGGAVAVDSNFNVYLAGGTNFIDMPIANGYTGTKQTGQPVRCGFDVWAARLTPPANNTQQYTPSFETYFGDPGASGSSCPAGSGDDIAYGVAGDGTSTYITGLTTSTNIAVPTTTTAFQSTNGGGSDAFVAKLGAPLNTGTSQGNTPLSYFTYLGGGNQDVGLSIVADSLQNARVTGLTKSANFPATANNPLQGSFQGGASDAFVARLVTTGTSSSTNVNTVSFLGGSGTDIGTSIALDPLLNEYVAGETSSGNFPKANPLPAGAGLSGGPDAFVAEVGPNTAGLSMPAVTPPNSTSPPPGVQNPTVSASPIGVGGTVKFTYYIYNTGDPVPGVVFTDTLGANSGTTTATSSGGSLNSCGSANAGQLICSLGTVPTSVITTTTSGGTTTTTIAPAANVSVTVTAPTTVLSGPLSLGNSASLSFAGGTTPPVQASVIVNDFAVSIVPPTASTVIAGGVATFKALVTPTGAGFSQSVSLSCPSGLPVGAACTFTNNPISTMTNGPQSRTFEITTTARVTTPASLFHRGPTYALWMPIFGVGLLGAGISRKRRILLGAFFVAVLGIALLQSGCSSGGSSGSSTTGTPAGTYTVVVNATAGATRSTSVQLTVQ